MEGLVDAINKYGFPIVAAGGVGYMIFFTWQWATTEVKPVLSEANTVLIALIDRIRMLDNDLIRLNQKLNIVLMLRGKEIESQRHLDDAKAAVAAQKVELEAEKTLKKAAQEVNKNEAAGGNG
jgi:multidrug resistance efflux pump